MEPPVSHYTNGSILWTQGVTIDPEARIEVNNDKQFLSLYDMRLNKKILDKFETSPLSFESITRDLSILGNLDVGQDGKIKISILKSPQGAAIGYMVRFSDVLIDIEKLPRNERLALSGTAVNGLSINNYIVGTEILAEDRYRFSVAGEEFFILDNQVNMVIKPDHYLPRPFSFEDNYLFIGNEGIKLVWPHNKF